MKKGNKCNSFDIRKPLLCLAIGSFLTSLVALPTFILGFVVSMFFFGTRMNVQGS